VTATHDGSGPHGPAKTPKKAALASWIGSVLEYYDFFIYGTAAALVFGKVFFPESDPATGTLLSFATYGVGYVARPVGAFFMGHIGDRYGRKRVLLLTVSLMGLCTFLVGCLPTYDDIGIWAPVLLVVLRLLQGLSASGEQAGANALSLEHADEHRRAFFTSFTLGGTQAGLIIATAVFLPIGAMPDDQLYSWGWRVPFWLSAVVVVVSLLIRRRLDETPAFQQAASEDATASVPLTILLRDHRWDVARVAAGALASTVSTIFAVWALSFAVDTVKLDRTTMLWVSIATNVVALAAIPAWATLADRVGRKPVFIFGAVGSGAAMFLYLGAISGGSYPLLFGAAILMSGIVYSAMNGVQPALYGEMFPTRVRLSGTAIGTQIGFAIGGFAPTAAAWIAGDGRDGWPPVAAYVLVSSLLAAIAVATVRETCKVPLADIDAGKDPGRTAAVTRDPASGGRFQRTAPQAPAAPEPDTIRRSTTSS
jgi:MFS family permease